MIIIGEKINGTIPKSGVPLRKKMKPTFVNWQLNKLKPVQIILMFVPVLPRILK